MNLSDFSDNALKRIPASQRPGVLTSDEAIEKFVARNERELQVQIANLLRQRGIWAYNARMDRKTTAAVGTCDFLFVLNAPLAVEVKHENRRLDPAQKTTIRQMLHNGWHCYLVRTLPQFRDLLNLYQSGNATTCTNILPGELE